MLSAWLLKHSRSCFLLAAFFLVPSAYCLAAGWLYKVEEVKPNVFVWVSDDVLDLEGDPQFDRAGTAGFILTPEGGVVVNTTNSPFHGRELLYEIRHRTELPVRYVIDTDSSGEQMLGNEVFTDQQATLISSSKTQEEILHYRELLARRLADGEGGEKLESRMRGFHVTSPTQTFGSEMALRLGGQEIKLRTLLKNGLEMTRSFVCPQPRSCSSVSCFKTAISLASTQETSMIGLMSCDRSRNGTWMSTSPAMARQAGRKSLQNSASFSNGLERKLKRDSRKGNPYAK